MSTSDARRKATGAEGEQADPRRSTVCSLPPEEVDDPVVCSILLVDDHPANLLALEAVLDPLGQRLVRANSGEEALKRLLHEEFAVILMDVQMPGLDGLQTAALIKERERTRHVPIIFLTAISKESAHVFRGYAKGAVDYLLKPFDPDILRSKVSVFVELHRRGVMLKRHEEMLRAQERETLERLQAQQLRELMNAMPLLVWAIDPHGALTYVNEAWTRYSGRTFERTGGGGWMETIHPDDREVVLATHARSLRDGTPMELAYRCRSVGGSFRWFLVRLVPQRDDSGAIRSWIGTGTDIDAQRRAHAALAEFKSTLDATLDGVVILAPETLELLYVNEGAARLLGRSTEALVGSSLLDAESTLDAAPLLDIVRELVAGRVSSHSYVTEVTRTDSGRTPVEVMLQHIDVDGAEGRLVAIMRDVTERVRIEDDLRRANAAKDDFLAAASHELRTPLAAAKAQVQLALRRLRDEPDEGPKRSLRITSTQIDRMTKLVEDLLDVSRIESKRLSLEVTRFDLAVMLAELRERLQGLSDAHQIELASPPNVPVVADRDRLEQVVNNLLSNAIRYTPHGGKVELRLSATDDEVHLAVRDHGVGIPLEKQAMIFERFGRAHGSRYGGLGLGLTISAGIVHQHGGAITVESSGVEGEGSTFHVRLPRKTESSPAD
ncbi:MAG: hypothetical protein NVSMB47_01750 [Polyangiales bacterium]